MLKLLLWGWVLAHLYQALPLPRPLWEASPSLYRRLVEGWWFVHGLLGGRGPKVGWRGLRGLLWAQACLQ